VLLAGVAGLLYGLLPGTASAASGTITACNETQLRADVTAGGSYTFDCSGTIVLISALLVSHEVSLTAAPPNTVTIEGFSSAPAVGTARRIFTVANGGSLELTGVVLSHGLVSAGPVETPSASHIPENGCIPSEFGWEGGECGITPAAPTNVGESGQSATVAGQNGRNAPAGGNAEGGCILIEQGGSATLTGDTISECATEGSSNKWLKGTGPAPGTEGIPGYKQGIGGFGGSGGYGAPGVEGGKHTTGHGLPGFCEGSYGEPFTPGGTGGNGTNGGNGGNGSEGGAGLGGAIYDAGSLIVSETAFLADRAIGGQGGAGGNGGAGGGGGAGSRGGEEAIIEGKEGAPGTGDGFESCHEVGHNYDPGSNGGNGSYGGNGGNGGNGGSGEGGAIFAQGYLAIIHSAFRSSLARGGNGGTAGLGGQGGQGGIGGPAGAPHAENVEAVRGGFGGSSGDGGSAGDSGNGGEAAGGAVFYATGSTGALPDASTVFESDNVLAGSICAGLGNTAEACGTTAGPAGTTGLGGESTPCKFVETRYQCPLSLEGTSGTVGAAGTIGVAGHSEGSEVAGAPGSAPPPTKKSSGESGGGSGGSSNGSGSNGGGSGGGGSSGGSGSSTNTSAPTPHAGSASASGNSISTSVSCTGSAGQSCTVTATITVQETLKSGKVTAVTSRKGKHPKVRHVTVTLGTVTATIAADSTRKLTVSLSGAGLRLLSSRHSLPVRFTVTSSLAGAAKAGTAPSVLEQINLTLRAAHAKGKH